MQIAACGIERAEGQLGQWGRIEAEQRMGVMIVAEPGFGGHQGRLAAPRRQLCDGRFGLPAAFGGLFGVPLQSIGRPAQRRVRLRAIIFACDRIPACLIQPLRILIGRILQQCLDACPLPVQPQAGVLQSLLGVFLGPCGLVQFRVRFVALPAGIVELRLCPPQAVRLAPAARAGVAPITLLEALDRLGQCLIVLELMAVLFELRQRIGDVRQSSSGARGGSASVSASDSARSSGLRESWG